MKKDRECNVCGDGIMLALLNGNPTHLQVNRILDGLETQSDLIGCGKEEVVCAPLKRLQKSKDLIEKECQ